MSDIPAKPKYRVTWEAIVGALILAAIAYFTRYH